MKSIIITLCLLVCVSGLPEIVEKYRPRIQEVHDFITNLETETHTHGFNVLGKIEEDIQFKGQLYRDTLEGLTDSIRNNIFQILGETGMAGHPELVVNCTAAEIQAVSDMIQYFNGGRDLAMDMAGSEKAKVVVFAEDMYKMLLDEHNTVQNDVNECSAIPTEYETLQCCQERFYTKVGPRQEELTEMVSKWNGAMTGSVKLMKEHLHIVFDLVWNRNLPFINIISDKFRQCCLDAKPPMSYK